jgi:hypothetical protein
MIAPVTHRLARGAACMLAAAAISTTVAAASYAAAPRYDGRWSVSIVTDKGDCDRAYRYPVRISHGELQNGGSNPFTISGRVAPSGRITVSVSSGSRSAIGTGRLAGDTGAGLWHGGACSGTWSAERRSS